jgi:hypothetical protein
MLSAAARLAKILAFSFTSALARVNQNLFRAVRTVRPLAMTIHIHHSVIRLARGKAGTED